MKDELEKAFDRIAVSTVPEQEDYTDSETGLLHCGICHTPKQCRVEIFGKEKLMPCTCRCRRLPFSITNNTETMNDKIKRMLKNEIQQMCAILTDGNLKTGSRLFLMNFLLM